MPNSQHHSVGSTQSRWRYALVTLGFLFGCLTLAPVAQAQEGTDDPVTGIEVTIDPQPVGSGPTQSSPAVPGIPPPVTPGFVWRDAVNKATGKVHCYDDEGDPVPNTPVSSITMTGPGSVSPTSGTTDQNGDIKVTITSTDISTDDTDGTVTATSAKVNGQGSVSFKGALEIKNGNTDVTKNPTNSMIGEQQSLAVSLRSKVQISSATWTISGGTPILNWQASDPNNPSASLTTPIPSSGLTGTSASFYVTTVGTATATVSVSDSGGSGTGSTSVNVSTPTFTFTATEIAPVDRTLGMALGSFDGSVIGIQFTGSGGSGGTLTSAQKITTHDAEITNSSGTIPVSYPNVPGLDTKFPYDQTGSPADSPYNNYVKGVTEANEAFIATMYLMWQSSKASIPIPVESISWDWEADVKFDSNTGKPLPNPVINPTTSNPPKKYKGTPFTTGVLEWSTTVTKTS